MLNRSISPRIKGAMILFILDYEVFQLVLKGNLGMRI